MTHEQATNLLSKYCHIHGAEITDGNVYRACLDAIHEAATASERRLFAAMAMQALAGKDDYMNEEGFDEMIAVDSVRIADVLIAELNKPQT